MTKLLVRWLSVFSVAAAAVLQVSAMASATAIFDRTVGTCTGNNCDSIEIGGRLSGSANGQAGPWTIEVLAGLNECIRLQVVQSEVDLEMVAISPNGQFYRNDDGPQGCSKCPLLRFQSPVRGNYTVSISQHNGTGPDARFRFAYGRYSAGNPNCNNPNSPL